jgi:hypothetical protein
MRSVRGLIALCAVISMILVAAATTVQAARAPKTTAFVHSVLAANDCVKNGTPDPSITILDNLLTNGNPNAAILVTVNESGSGFTVTGPISVLYDATGSLCGSAGRWLLVNRDLGDYPTGQLLNIFISAP